METVVPKATENNEIPTANSGGVLFKLLGQLVNGRNRPPRIGPFALMFFIQLPTLSKIAGATRVFNQARGEEIQFVLKDWRVESQVLELSTNLSHAAESQRFNAESCWQ